MLLHLNMRVVNLNMIQTLESTITEIEKMLHGSYHYSIKSYETKMGMIDQIENKIEQHLWNSFVVLKFTFWVIRGLVLQSPNLNNVVVVSYRVTKVRMTIRKSWEAKNEIFNLMDDKLENSYKNEKSPSWQRFIISWVYKGLWVEGKN